MEILSWNTISKQEHPNLWNEEVWIGQLDHNGTMLFCEGFFTGFDRDGRTKAYVKSGIRPVKFAGQVVGQEGFYQQVKDVTHWAPIKIQGSNLPAPHISTEEKGDLTPEEFFQTQTKPEASFKWLIWNFERMAWWTGNRVGYTMNRDEAGRFSFEDALEIVQDANINMKDEPEEAMVPDVTY